MSKSNAAALSASPKASESPMLITVFRKHSEVVDERLDEQYRRVMEVAGNIEAAKEAWRRSSLVCSVEVGKQTEALEATKKMHSLLKAAAEALIEIVSEIEPRAICQFGEDSILRHYSAEETANEGRAARKSGSEGGREVTQ